MKIGLDFHGVVVDSHGLKSTLLKEIFGADVSVGDCRKVTQKPRGKEVYKQYRHVQRLIYETRAYHRRLKPTPGALQGIRELRGLGHELVIVTSSSPQAAALGRRWLDTHELDIPLIVSNRWPSKTRAVRKLKLDGLVEDDLPKLKLVMGVVPWLCLLRQPHNLSIVDAGPNIGIAESWAEIVKTFSEPAESP
jgi:beta-phosphoglucomutase-like phosphatase (HAD superfamily)